MIASASGRISAAKTGWIIALLMVGWALFLFLPFGSTEKAESTKVSVAHPGEAELAAVGLGYNIDWIGLPEYFAVWAGRTKWQDDKVRFAYWNPGSNSYSYYFEATRRDGRYRFRPLVRADLERKSGYYVDDEDEVITEEVPEPRSITATHPFIFWDDDRRYAPQGIRITPGILTSYPTPASLKVEMPVKKFEVPKKLDGEISPDVFRK